MTDTVYSVRGGYEDWAYAAGWEKDAINKCENYEEERYYNIDARCIMFLVEADKQKHPVKSTYGTSEAVERALEQWPPKFYRKESEIGKDEVLKKGYGHIARNVMLSLTMIDLLKPYVIRESAREFRVGGCKRVDSLQVLADGGAVIKQFTKTPGIWEDPSYTYTVDIGESGRATFRIRCDSEFGEQVDPSPNVKPQTFWMQSRMNTAFAAEVNGHVKKSELLYEYELDGDRWVELVPEEQ